MAWLQLVADDGKINLDLVQGLVQHDLKSLSTVPVLCIDDVDVLRPREVEAHRQICAFLESLHNTTPQLLLGQLVPPQIHTDLSQILNGLTPQALNRLLAEAGIALSLNDCERLHRYTGGNARLLNLFVSLYRAGEPLDDALGSMADTPSLDALFQRVEERLNSVERSLLRSLAVFRRSAPVDAWNSDEERVALERLLEWHLLERDTQGGVALVPVLRDALYRSIAAEEKELAHLRAATIRAERGEYTAAAHHYLNGGQPRLAVWLWYIHRDEEKLQGQAEAGHSILRHVSGNQLGEDDRKVLALARSDLEIAAGLYDQAATSLQHVAEYHDDLLGALIERMRGHVATMQNEFDRAIESYRQGLVTVERLIGERALFRKNLSWAGMRQKNLDDAWHEACLARYEAENIQGYIQMELGNYAAAQSYYEDALAMAIDACYVHGEAKTRDNLGRLLAIRGSFPEAKVLSTEAHRLFMQIGDKANAMGVTINEAMAANLAEQPQLASERAQQALEWFSQINEPWGQAAAAQNLAEAYLALGDITKAKTFAQRVLDSGEIGTMPDGLRVMGEVRLAQGDFAEAEQNIRRSIEMAQENQDRYLEAYGWRALAKAYVVQRKFNDAQQAGESAIKLFETLELPHEVDRTREVL